MIRKLIHSSFELDLSNLKLSVVRENHWFSDSFFTKYSFPFEIPLTDELDAALGFISRPNSKDKKTYLELKYYHNNTIQDAILEIEEYVENLSATLRFGYEQLPSFPKKLSEFALDKFELPEGVDVYEHAETIITQTWPAVNYNFPQIHTDKIDPDNDDVYFAFEKIINNRKEGEFLINEVVEEGGDSVTYNRNIMQPLPYMLHILKKGFEDSNLTLAGEILEDSRLKKTLIYADVDYATTVTQESTTIITTSEEFVEEGTVLVNNQLIVTNNLIPTFPLGWARYYVNQTIDNPGRYRIIGKVYLHNHSPGYTKITIKYRDQIIFNNNISYLNYYTNFTVNVNVVFDTLADLNPNFITIESTQRKTVDKIIFDLAINPVRLHDAEGNPIPTIINKNEIDLTKSVPDMTFEEYLKFIKNYMNYDLTVAGTNAIMNKVVSKLKETETISLQEFEVKKPVIKFTKGISFLLKFADVDSENYTYSPVFHNLNSILTANYKSDDKTNTIEINALPLPLLFRNDVQTAHAFESNNSKPYMVIYDGLTEGKNLCKSPDELLLQSIHEAYYRAWFDFRINSEDYSWSFICDGFKLLEMQLQTKTYAYGRVHVIRNINDIEVSPDVYEIDLETSTFE